MCKGRVPMESSGNDHLDPGDKRSDPEVEVCKVSTKASQAFRIPSERKRGSQASKSPVYTERSKREGCWSLKRAFVRGCASDHDQGEEPNTKRSESE
jgi:hypothetical protein